MANLKFKLKEAAEQGFSLPTNQSHTLTLTPPKLFVLDVEDAHYNTDRSVLLPDLSSVDGSQPVLTAQRVTGLGVLYAALSHAKQNASQGLCVTGHTDGSGSAGHNLGLSEDRAKGVSLLLRGLRAEWAELAAKKDAVDDYQTVLVWQNKRAGWDCDPGPINNQLSKRTKAAIKAFQERYNAEVERVQSEKLDSPFKQKIKVDSAVGKETWGAIYDVYMSELMELFEFEKFSELEQLQKPLKAPPGMPDFVGCGENIGFKAARRDPFEQVDPKLEEPSKNPPDRRVEILFFDPGEEVKLDCHPAPGQCKPAECPIYVKVPHRQQPIGIPKGLAIAEVNLRLTFVDPEGKVRPFPAGLPVLAKFGTPPDEPAPPEPAPAPEHVKLDAEDFDLESDSGSDEQAPAEPQGQAEPAPDASEAETDPSEVAQEPTVFSAEDGLVRFEIPRKASSLYLRFFAGLERRFVSCDPAQLADQKLMSEKEASEAVAQGRVFFMLPESFHTKQGYFELPSPGAVSFKDGAFQNVDAKKTQLGTREAPLELRLKIRWQYFQFDYFDRYTLSLTQLPQVGPAAEGAPAQPALALQGAAALLEAGSGPTASAARSAWHVIQGKATIHCLAWVARETFEGKPIRELPDAQCTALFRSSNAFVRTEGDGSSPDAERKLVSFAASDKAPQTPGVERLRLYDVPAEWRSRLYPARFGGESIDKAKPFEQLDPNGSALGKPYVFSLDTIVLGAASGSAHDTSVQWDDSKLANRFTIFDHKLQVYKADPPAQDPYFTKLADLKPQPSAAVLLDHAPFTRLIARQHMLYDVFHERTTATSGYAGAPVGARLARRLLSKSNPGALATPAALPATLLVAPFEAARANATQSAPIEIGDSITAVVRCCGHEQDVELFHVLQYITVSFHCATAFSAAEKQKYPMLKNAVPLKSAPPDIDSRTRDCLLNVAKRWNGKDEVNPHATRFEVGSPVSARGAYLAFLSRGARAKTDPLQPGEVRINLFESGRSFMSGGSPEGYWHLDKLAADSSGWFTAAHETGHIFSQPDEYKNTDDQPSYGQPNITEAYRSAGTPYGYDTSAMMVHNQKVRARYFWDFLLWAREWGHFADTDELAVKRDKIRFKAEVTKLFESRVRLPVKPKQSVKLGASGFADLFLYATGRDEFLAKDIDKFAGAKPYDGLLMVRVRMAWEVKTTKDYDDLVELMKRAQESIETHFNDDHPVVVQAKYQGRAVRLRVLFAPRLVCITPGEDDDDSFKAYLKGLHPALPALTGAEYKKRAESLASANAHIRVSVQKADQRSFDAKSAPRKAVVRADAKILLIFGSAHFDEDVLATFRQMVGARVESSSSAGDYAGFVAGIRSAYSELSEIALEVLA